MYYGPEMTSHHFTDWAKDNQIELLFIQPGKPNQNAYIERFNRSFRTEVLDANLFNSVSEAQAAADEWVTEWFHGQYQLYGDHFERIGGTAVTVGH